MRELKYSVKIVTTKYLVNTARHIIK